MYKRPLYKTLKKRMSEKRKFMQVLFGPRQTGKTTIVRQLMEDLKILSHYASADEPALKGAAWIEQQWETARVQSAGKQALLILDEIHKIQTGLKPSNDYGMRTQQNASPCKLFSLVQLLYLFKPACRKVWRDVLKSFPLRTGHILKCTMPLDGTSINIYVMAAIPALLTCSLKALKRILKDGATTSWNL